MLSVEIKMVGTSAEVELPDEVIARLKVKEGDSLFLVETPDSGYRLTARNPEVERQMLLAEEIAHEDRDVLRALKDDPSR
jgi:putative addiction module antidote